MVQLKNITSNSNGNMNIWGIFFAIFLVMIFMVFFEKHSLETIVDESSKDVTSTLTSTASGNLYRSSFSVRDGTSGTFTFAGEDFFEIKDTSKFIDMYTQLYNSSSSTSDSITKSVDGKAIFKITDISLYVSNATGEEKRSTYICDYQLTVYLDLLWSGKEVVLDNQRQIVQYINKF